MCRFFCLTFTALLFLFSLSGCYLNSSIIANDKTLASNSGTTPTTPTTPTTDPSALILTPNTSSVLKIITGESLQFLASGGTYPYVFSAGTSSYLSSAGLYSPSLGASPSTDTLTVTDSKGQSKTQSIQVRAFQTLNQYSTDPSAITTSSYVRFVTGNATGTVYAVGDSPNSYGVSVWIVRKSTDGGQTWAQSDSYIHSGATDSSARAAAIAPGGDILIVGQATVSSTPYWIVRKSTDGGTTWSNADVFSNAQAANIKVDSLGNIFVVGSGSSNWIVRKSSDGGSSWSTVDSGTMTGISASALAIGIDSADSIYVGGNFYTNIGFDSTWIVRKSSNSGGSWSTVDSFNLHTSKHNFVNSITVDSSGNIFAAGTGDNALSKRRWIVRKSSNGGSSWTTVDDYARNTNYDSQARSIAAVGASTLLSVGFGTNTTSGTHWITRRSTDGGSSWSTVNDFASLTYQDATSVFIGPTLAVAVGSSGSSSTWIARYSADTGTNWTTSETYSYSSGAHTTSRGMASNGSGNIYTTADTGGYENWIVRKSTDSGLNWTISESVSLEDGSGSQARRVLTSQSGDVFTSGYAYFSGGSASKWIVRKSTDAGASWSSSDNYVHSGGVSFSSANDIIETTAGNILSVGTAAGSDFVNDWLVRRTTNSGGSWSTVDDFNYSPNKSAFANAIAHASSGEIYVVGACADASNYTHWIVRKSTDNGSTWTTVDVFQLSTNKISQAHSVAAKANGVVFVGGLGVDSGNKQIWLVRKSSDFGATWTTVDSLQMDATNTSGNYASSIVIDSNGHWYVGGTNSTATSMNAYIRKSTDEGTTWVTVDMIPRAAVVILNPCASDRICAVGKATPSDTVNPTAFFRILSP